MDHDSHTSRQNPGESILEVARNVATVFARGRAKHVEHYLKSELENELGRFKIWAGNLGVFAPGNASADYRLREDSDIREVIIQMLGRLRQNIKQAIDPPIIEEPDVYGEDGADRNTDSSSESSMSISLDEDSDAETEQDSDPDDIPKQALSEIKNIMTRLYRLSAIIKKPTSTTENVKVANFIAKEEETEEMKEFEGSVRWQIQFRHPETAPSLLEKLVNAAIFRRRKLQYRERHKEKLGQGVEQSLSVNLPMPTTAQIAAAKALGHHRTSFPLINMKGSSARGSSRTFQFSATDASSVNRLKFASYPKSVALSGITKSAVARREGLDVPRPPTKDDDGSKEAICPYCFRIVEKEEMMQLRWKRHILRDIEPYVCLFDDCDRPNELFKTIEEWVSHMQWQHAVVWSCQAPGHESSVYRSRGDFEHHLRSDHENAFNESQLPVIIQKSAQPGPDIFTTLAVSKDSNASESIGVCLFCPFSFEEPVASRPSDHLDVEPAVDTASKRVRDHIAAHLEAIALLSLPERDDLDDATTDERESEGTKSSLQVDHQDLPSAEFQDELMGQSLSDDEEAISGEYLPGELREEWGLIVGDSRVNRTSCPEQTQDPTLREFVKRARRIEMVRKQEVMKIPIIIVYDPDGLEISFNDPDQPAMGRVDASGYE